MCFYLKTTRFGPDIVNHHAKNIQSCRIKWSIQTIIMFYLVSRIFIIYLFYNKIVKF